MSDPGPDWQGCTAVRVLDGDTLDVLGPYRFPVELPFGAPAALVADVPFRVRLNGVNAAKLGSGAGDVCAAFVEEWCAAGPFTVTTLGHYKYGGPKWSPYAEFMADVARDGDDLVEELLDHLLAVYWNGEGPRPEDGA